MTDPDEIAAAVARFMSERDQFARALGIELLDLRPGYSRVGMTIAPYMVNGLGIAHGGVIFSLGDFAFAAAGNSHGQTAVALSMDIHFLRTPDPGTYLTAEAIEVRKGRRTALYRITISDAQGNLIADLHGMAYRKEEGFLRA